MRLALVHYSFPPVVGGVETVLGEHARVFAGRGHEVLALGGSGADGVGFSFELIPELAADHPLGPEMAAELASGAPGVAFAELQRRLATFFATRLGGFDVVLIHNVLAMPFHLAASAALWAWAESRPRPRIVNWIHDLAALNPDYTFADPAAFPWSLLRTIPSGVECVTISEHRRRQVQALMGANARVIPNGLDPARVLALPPRVADFLKRLGWPRRGPILFHPTRILRRKNIEAGIALTAALRARGSDALYLVSGAPDPHQTASREYGAELRSAIAGGSLGNAVVFIQDHFSPDEAEIAAFHRASDALLLPSRQEGFGLPAIEAAWNRVPIFHSGIEPLEEILAGRGVILDPAASPAAQADLVLATLAADRAGALRRETLLRFASSGEAGARLLELIEGGA